MILEAIDKLRREIDQGIDEAPRQTVFRFSRLFGVGAVLNGVCFLLLLGEAGDLSPFAGLHISLFWGMCGFAGASVLLFALGWCLPAHWDKKGAE